MKREDSRYRDNHGDQWDDGLCSLYEANYDELIGQAMYYLDTVSLAEEAVQDAVVKYQLSRTKPTPGKELSYLRSIVINNARSMLRSRRSRQFWLVDPSFQPQLVEQSTPEDRFTRGEQCRAVMEELRNLPRRQREVIMLRHCAQLSERATAQQLGISAGSVKTHAWRGREALRDAMTARGAA